MFKYEKREAKKTAKVFVSLSREELGDMPQTLQETIDLLNDHNQTMLDSMTPVLADTVRKSMAQEDDERWIDIVNECFDQARRLIGA